MADPVRCTCPRCSIRHLMGPVVVTTIGVLFLLSEMRGGYFHIGHTFPVLLIVIGIILLVSALAPMDGHIESPGSVSPGSGAQPGTPAPPAPPPTYSNPYSGQGQ
jgi:hypothetical protein